MTSWTGTDERGRVRTIVNRTTELAPLKVVAAKAIALAEDERSAALDLAAVISSDQALTAKLLRLANSAYYGYARRISNVREAVILLGMRTVRSVAIASSIMDAFRVPETEGFDVELFWGHAVAVGVVAEHIARETRAARPEDAFTAGVLHDVGRLAMAVVEPDRFQTMVRLVVEEGMTTREAEFAAFGVYHWQVGSRLAQRWRFPEPLVEAIREHAKSDTRSLSSLADVVAAANLACNKFGYAAGFDWTNRPERWPTLALSPRVERVLDAVPGGIHALMERARTFLVNVSSRPPRWFRSPLADGAEEEQPEPGTAIDGAA